MNVSSGTGLPGLSRTNGCEMVVVVVVICAVSDHDDTVNEAGNYCITDEYVVTDIGDNAHLIAQQQRWDLNYREAAVYLQEGENNDKFYAHPSRQVFNPSCSRSAGIQSKLFQVGRYSVQVVLSWQVFNPSCSRSAGIQSKLFRVGRYSIQVVPGQQVFSSSNLASNNSLAWLAHSVSAALLCLSCLPLQNFSSCCMPLQQLCPTQYPHPPHTHLFNGPVSGTT